MTKINVPSSHMPYLQTLLDQNGLTIDTVPFEIFIDILNIDNIPYKITKEDNDINKHLNIVIDETIFQGKIVKSNESCGICMEKLIKDDEIIRLKCSHYFHNECIMESIKFTNTCPLCRDTIKIHY